MWRYAQISLYRTDGKPVTMDISVLRNDIPSQTKVYRNHGNRCDITSSEVTMETWL
jgi:hypothetical protein